MLYWRRSLIVTVILLILGLAENGLYGQVFSFAAITSNYSVSELASVLGVFSIAISALVHFFVLWWAFRHYSPMNEKVRRAKTLSADDVLAMLNEDEVTALRQRLLPPSERGNLSA